MELYTVSEANHSLESLTQGISVIVPVFNSEATLPELVQRLQSVLKDLSKHYQLIFVNDCSRDRSWEVISDLAEKHGWVSGINLMRNFGQHNALLCGIREARYDTIVTLDDDLQNPPEEIPKLLEKLREGYDVVYGPPQHEQHGFLRDRASQITKWALQSAMGADTARSVSAFRAFRTRLRAAFDNYCGPYVSIDVLLTWGTTRFTAVPVRQDQRTVGVSNYTLSKLIKHALNMITGFSTFPLQVASIIGFVFMFFGLGILAYALGQYIIHRGAVPGFTFLASIISIFSGVQLFVLGIVGEYLARMHFRMMDRPTYVVRDRIKNPEGKNN